MKVILIIAGLLIISRFIYAAVRCIRAYMNLLKHIDEQRKE